MVINHLTNQYNNNYNQYIFIYVQAWQDHSGPGQDDGICWYYPSGPSPGRANYIGRLLICYKPVSTLGFHPEALQRRSFIQALLSKPKKSCEILSTSVCP